MVSLLSDCCCCCWLCWSFGQRLRQRTNQLAAMLPTTGQQGQLERSSRACNCSIPSAQNQRNLRCALVPCGFALVLVLNQRKKGVILWQRAATNWRANSSNTIKMWPSCVVAASQAYTVTTLLPLPSRLQTALWGVERDRRLISGYSPGSKLQWPGSCGSPAPSGSASHRCASAGSRCPACMMWCTTDPYITGTTQQKQGGCSEHVTHTRLAGGFVVCGSDVLQVAVVVLSLTCRVANHSAANKQRCCCLKFRQRCGVASQLCAQPLTLSMPAFSATRARPARRWHFTPDCPLIATTPTCPLWLRRTWLLRYVTASSTSLCRAWRTVSGPLAMPCVNAV